MRLRMVSVVPILQRSMPETPLAAWISEFQVQECSSFWEKEKPALVWEQWAQQSRDQQRLQEVWRRRSHSLAKTQAEKNIISDRLEVSKYEFQPEWVCIQTSFRDGLQLQRCLQLQSEPLETPFQGFGNCWSLMAFICFALVLKLEIGFQMKLKFLKTSLCPIADPLYNARALGDTWDQTLRSSDYSL